MIVFLQRWRLSQTNECGISTLHHNLPSWNLLIHLELEQLISWPVRGYVVPKGNITQKNHPSSHLRGSVNYLSDKGFGICSPLIPSLALSPSQAFCILNVL